MSYYGNWLCILFSFKYVAFVELPKVIRIIVYLKVFRSSSVENLGYGVIWLSLQMKSLSNILRFILIILEYLVQWFPTLKLNNLKIDKLLATLS